MIYLNRTRKRQLSEYLLQLSIAHNPHSKKPKRLFDDLRRQLDEVDETPSEGISKLKKAMQKGAKFKVK